MKEFEKFCKGFKPIKTNDREGWRVNPTIKETWRAALEWVISQRSAGIEEDGTVSYCDFVFTRVIKDELEEN